ncbi:D-galactonate transporter [Candidatus Sulfotelmatobacter sp. SbA7]|nr:D-galactonate transporter [Candidatus Sulfotelmatobacter sp. SbA7]
MPTTRGGPIAAVDEAAIHTRRQIAVRLLPFLFILYVTNYLDRTSVAYAALDMSRDLGFTDRVFGLGAGIFFISYVALQIPGALLVELWSARRCIGVIMVAWGSLTVLTGLVHTANQLYLARLVLGAAEAGFFPGVVVYLSHWFIREDRAKAISNFMAAIPLSFIIGSPVAGWILGHHWLGFEGWRWLFALEGLPAMLLGVVGFFYLTDWPVQASWLRPQQRDWIAQTLQEEKAADVGKVSMWRALGSRPVLLLASAAFLEYFVFYTVAFWFPTILKRLTGLSNQRIGVLGTVPYVACLAAMLINGWHSDKQGERRLHSAIPLFIAAAGVLGLLTLPGSLWLTMVLFSMLVVAEAFLAPFWALVTEMLGETAAATAVGFINAVGSVAGFAGPYAFGYLNTRTGSFSAGLTVMLICCLGSGLLLLWAPDPPKLPV